MDDTTAYHEAGHAFAAVQLGAFVRSVTIEPDNDDEPRRYGDTKIEWDHSVVSGKELCKRMVLVSLAGPVAEMIYSGEPYHPGFVPEWGSDWKQAWLAAEAIHAADRARLLFLEQAAGEMYRLFQQDENWATLAAIVDDLLAHETLDGEAVHAIVRCWSR
jgi:ATP-dependent Zn protease